MKSVIIDDSTTHRTVLEKLIENHPDLVLEGSYRNGIVAKNKGCEKNADLIFLDVEMPFIDGFDLLESFKERPQVIIISGSPDHALRAFDYDVTDYLLKPVSAKRFDMAIKKVQRNIGTSNRQHEEHIFVRSNFRKVRVDYSDIKWIEALGDYVKLITEKKKILVLTSMKAFEQKLPENRFLRIHKSYIINLDCVQNFSTTAVQVCGKQLPISRKRKSRLLEALRVQ